MTFIPILASSRSVLWKIHPYRRACNIPRRRAACRAASLSRHTRSMEGFFDTTGPCELRGILCRRRKGGSSASNSRVASETGPTGNSCGASHGSRTTFSRNASGPIRTSPALACTGAPARTRGFCAHGGCRPMLAASALARPRLTSPSFSLWRGQGTGRPVSRARGSFREPSSARTPSGRGRRSRRCR